MRRTILVVLLSLCVFPSLRAQTIAKYAGEFLAIGVGGRALGLGGAYAALANDATAGYWNPSALSRIDYPEFVLMHDERFGGLMNYDFGAVAIPYGSDISFGLSLSRLSVDDIPDTRNALIDYNNNGVFDPEDRPDPNRVTYFNVADWVLTLTYAKRSSDEFRYGANVKLIRRNFGDFSATGIGFDVGVLYSPLQDLWLAANAQDVTTTLIAWSTGRNELVSPTLKLGAAYFVNAFNGRFAPTMDVDVRFENRQSASIANVGPISLDPHFGLEFDYKQTAAIRIGYSDVKQLTVGAGLHLRKLDLDYSFARFGKENDLGDTHRISIRFMLQEERWGRGNGGNIGE